jgi:DNA-directed RNA polymerase subunit K/omega
MALARALQSSPGMKPLLVAPAANDLPEPAATERARERVRERRIRGPNWSQPPREAKAS